MSAPPLHHSLMERGLGGVRQLEFNFPFTCTIITTDAKGQHQEVQTKEGY